jgi:hypothetical protein
MTEIFKICSCCQKTWDSSDDFFNDSGELKLIGYQEDPKDLGHGIIYFNHENGNCGTTLSLRIEAFKRIFDIKKETSYLNSNLGTYCQYKCLQKNHDISCAGIDCIYIVPSLILDLIRQRLNYSKKEVSHEI